ncbi:MAG: MATE family efflux transporter [Bacteroidota bacterium]
MMNRTILRLAIPNILSNLSVPLLGIVDTALMGRMETESYLGAIALGSIIFNFIYWGFGFLRMGTTGMTAQAYGSEEQLEAATILGRGLWVAGVAGVVILFTQVGIEVLGFQLMQGKEAIKDLGRSYFYIRIWAAPATLAGFVLTGWFLGMQNARIPMIMTVLLNLFNIIFNMVFVYGLGMKSDGVALGTVIAQYLGLAIGLFFLKKHFPDSLKLLDRKKILNLAEMKRFFTVNADIFIRTVCLIFVFAFFTSQSSGQSETVLAANQILLQYFFVTGFAVDGFAFAAESLVGRFIGAKDKKDLREVLRLLFIWGCGIGLIFSLFYWMFGSSLLSVFTDLEQVQEAARPYLWWIVILPFFGAIAFMWDGVYIGATATRPMRNTMLVATLGIFLPAFYLAFPVWGNHGLWLAMILFIMGRGLFLTFTAPRHILGKNTDIKAPL